MAQRSRRKEPQRPDRLLGGLVVMVTVMTIVGLSIADFFVWGHVENALVAALVVVALTFGGYGTDRLFNRF